MVIDFLFQADLKKGKAEEVISLHPLDISPEKQVVPNGEAIVANGGVSLVNGDASVASGENSLGNEAETLVTALEDSLVNEIVDVLVNGKKDDLDNGQPEKTGDTLVEDVVEAKAEVAESAPITAATIARGTGQDEPKVGEKPIVEDIGPKANGFVGSEAVNMDEGTRNAATKRKRSREQKSNAGGKEKSGGDAKEALLDSSSAPTSAPTSSSSSSSSKSWHWSYYLIPAALIAILAISVHLFREKTRVTEG